MSAIFVGNCSFPRVNVVPVTRTPKVIVVTATDTALPSLATPELGLAENPVIFALPPSANSSDQIAAANLIAAEFTQRTGYTVVTIAPNTYAELVDALEKGNANIVLLDPFAYAFAYQKGLVYAQYGLVKDDKSTYGAQFLASRKGGFQSFYDSDKGENTAEASVALAQFADKKPCWSDGSSASGYVIPLGFLRQNLIAPRDAAFVGGQPTVVRSLYATGICDFGATYIDARKFPSLEDQFPDLLEQVIVVWHTPEIIPYNIIAFSKTMPEGMRKLFSDQIAAIMQTDNGRAAFLTAYGVEQLQVVNDGFYQDFRTYVNASGVDLTTLVK
jgi:ABC-type phosphate/phosphonate transport system substrate-binding protein